MSTETMVSALGPTSGPSATPVEEVATAGVKPSSQAPGAGAGGAVFFQASV